MANINRLTSGMQYEHLGNYEIGLTLNKQDFDILESTLIQAKNSIMETQSKESTKEKELLTNITNGFSAFKKWDKQNPPKQTVNILSSGLFRLPLQSANVFLPYAKQDNQQPDLILLFSVEELKELRNALKYVQANSYLKDSQQITDYIKEFTSFLNTTFEVK